MRLYEFTTTRPTSEASYPGNIGIMELIKFNKIASGTQKNLFKKLASLGRDHEAWDLIQKVTGVKLHQVDNEFA